MTQALSPSTTLLTVLQTSPGLFLLVEVCTVQAFVCPGQDTSYSNVGKMQKHSIKQSSSYSGKYLTSTKKSVKTGTNKSQQK